MADRRPGADAFEERELERVEGSHRSSETPPFDDTDQLKAFRVPPHGSILSPGQDIILYCKFNKETLQYR